MAAKVVPWGRCRRWATVSLAYGLTSTAISAWAIPASSLADLSLEELASIEITSASKRAQSLADAATSVYVITADDIRRSGATSLPDALRLAPNLHVAKQANTEYAISARGMTGVSPNKLLVLIDGRTVYSPLFAGVFWDVQNPMLEDVERIEVISGPGGTLWGVNAVNGVINVITRSSQATQGTLVAAGAGNRGAEISARQGGKLGEEASYRIYAKHFNLNHTQLADGSDVRDVAQMSQAGFRADWKRGGDQFVAQGDFYQGDRGQPEPGSIVLGIPLELGTIQTSGANVLGRWTRNMGSGSLLSLQGYVEHTRRIVPPTFSEDLDIADIQFQYALPPSDTHAWVYGGEHRQSNDRLTNSRYFGFLPANLSQSWSSLFAQDEIALRDNLHLTLGARLERNDYTGNEFLPNARLAWKIKPQHLLWTAMSRTARAPSRLDRDPYVPWPDELGPAASTYLLGGGPHVRSEIAQVYELGYRGQPAEALSYSVTLYRALYDRLRTQELKATADDFFVFENNMKAAVSGIEMWATYQPVDNWRLSAGFAGLYQRFSLRPDSTDPVSLDAVSGNDPAQTWQIRASWDLPRNVELDWTVRHVSALYSPYVPGYVAVDVRGGWRVSPHLSLSLTGRNLFGTAHAEYSDIALRTQVGPSVFLQAVLQF